MTRLLSGVALGLAALAAILFLPFLVLRLLVCIVALVATREPVWEVITMSRASRNESS